MPSLLFNRTRREIWRGPEAGQGWLFRNPRQTILRPEYESGIGLVYTVDLATLR